MAADHPSARLAFETDLRTREQYLALVFNSARDMMLLGKVEPGALFRIVSVNRPYVETIRAAGFKLDATDFEGRTFAETVALFGFEATAAAELRGRYEQVIRTHQPLEYKEVSQTPTGIFHGRSTITPILDETGDCRYVLYSSQDVTERMRAEQALRESEEKFATAFRVSPDIMSISEYDTGRYLEVNEAHEKIFGFSRAESIGRSPLELGILREQAVRDEMLRRMMAQDGHVRDFQVEAWNRRGEALTILLSAEVIELGGRKCVLRNSRDITAAGQAELARRQSEEKFAKAFRATPDAIAITDLETGVFLEANGSYERIFGVPAATFIGRSTLEMNFYRDPADRARIVERIRTHGSVHNVELQCYNQRREPIVVLYSGDAIEMNGRKCLVSVIHDITARKQTEQALRESEEKFATVFREAPVWIVISDVASSVCLEVNEAALRASGYRREEVVGHTGAELGWIKAEDRDRLVSRMQAKGRVTDYEMTFRAKDGRELHGLVSCEPIVVGGRSCTLSVTIDITERKQAEAALKESTAQLQSILGVAPIGVARVADRTIYEVNGAMAQMLGYTQEELYGQPTRLLYASEEEFQAVGALVARVNAKNQASFSFETRLRLKDGRTIDVVINAVRHDPANPGAGTVIAVMDISERKRTEQALRQSEDKFALIFRSSPDAISVHEMASGRYLDINPGFQRLFGYTREEAVGRTPMEMGIWEDPAERNAFVTLLQRDGHVRGFQVRFRLRTGEVRLCEISAEVVELNGRPHNISVLRDITQRLQAERALRDSEEKFAKAFRASPDAISISEKATGKFLDVNEGFERSSGYARGELIGHTAHELGIWTAPEDRTKMLQELGRHGRVKNLQVRARSRTGKQGDFLMSVETVEIAGRACLVIVSRDITELVQSGKALRESEEKFALAFRSSPHPLIISELASGRYVDVNHGFERITGYSREEVIGRTAFELNIWESLADRDELMSRLQRDGTVRDMEIRFRQKYGGILITRCSFERIELADQPCMLSSIEDITEQRRVEEQHLAMEAQLRQNQKLEALGTLAGGIAHDFNNILTAIIVNQELAYMDATEPEAVRQRLAEIGRASNRAKELVRQILTFSRQQQHERLKQRLQPIIQEALGLLRSSLPATIAMEQNLAPEAPPVLADASQVHQVVMNLCTNAAHALRHQPGRLEVRLAPRILDAAACLTLPGLKPGRYAHLTVSDTGHGMEASVLTRIFEPFFTTKGPGEGTGLGLPMVHGIMQDHDGAVFVQSSPGVGTTFDLYFPEATEHDITQTLVDTDIVPGHGESVMVVDDEEAICRAIGAMLRRLGYQVQTFTEPRLALACFQAGPASFDLLLTDHTMPQLSGPQLIAQVRESRPGLPVLLMSGLDSPLGQSGGHEGVYRLVAKPIDFAELSRIMRQALQTKPSP